LAINQINDSPCQLGEVMAVRVLGTLALVDGGETDWKLIVVRVRTASFVADRQCPESPRTMRPKQIADRCWCLGCSCAISTPTWRARVSMRTAR
jgi:inorganic pyrophosphatase